MSNEKRLCEYKAGEEYIYNDGKERSKVKSWEWQSGSIFEVVLENNVIVRQHFSTRKTEVIT